MATPEELDVEAAVLEHEAVKLEEQNRPVAAQVKLQQAKSKRDQAALRRQQAGEMILFAWLKRKGYRRTSLQKTQLVSYL